MAAAAGVGVGVGVERYHRVIAGFPARRQQPESMPDSVDPRDEPFVEGDASSHLEELIVGALPAAELEVAVGTQVTVELVGPHLRMSGTIGLGRFRRLSDLLNNHDGLIGLHDATILRRNGTATRVTAPTIWVSPAEVTLIGESSPSEAVEAPVEFRIPKTARPLVFVTPGHTLTGEVHIVEGGQLSSFIESNDPPFIALTDARTRSLADRRIIARYDFALLNRRHIVATTELAPDMIRGRSVL
jgi:hypothetical protein